MDTETEHRDAIGWVSLIARMLIVLTLVGASIAALVKFALSGSLAGGMAGLMAVVVIAVTVVIILRLLARRSDTLTIAGESSTPDERQQGLSVRARARAGNTALTYVLLAGMGLYLFDVPLSPVGVYEVFTGGAVIVYVVAHYGLSWRYSRKR